MATLVLTTVGTMIGGPFGGAIGAILGQQVDQRLFAPRRVGPRLGELGVQTSSYGQPIPRLFGCLRVAGTVIWATDLREERHRSGGGKGKPKTTTYSYSASFAVALSARPIRGVRRIWADGKLLRGAAGDWKSETGYRLYKGGEDQPADPLIAAAQGIIQAPAHRGLAYAVFQDFQLADYGNRIPSLTFEVEADEGPVSLATIAAELSNGAMSGETAAALRGFAATGDSVRGAIEAVTRVLPVSVTDDGESLVLMDDPGPATVLSHDETGARADRKAVARIVRERTATGALSDEVAITYYEPERDYQAGLQRARRSGAGRRAERIELPAALSAAEAKGAAARRLADIWAARTGATVFLPWRRAVLRPGHDVIAAAGPAMRIRRWTLDGMVVELKLAGIAGAPSPLIAQPGGGVREPDLPHGPTTLALLDLPPLEVAPATTPAIWVAAAGVSAGWRRAAVTFSLDGGISWTDAGATAAAAVMGVAETILPGGDAALIDSLASVDVALLNPDMVLTGCDDVALVNGANAAMIGDELIQFGRADLLGAGRYRLSRLLRGRRGSEWASAHHAAGETFVLLAEESLLRIDLPTETIGGTVEMMASGVGDGVPAMAATTVSGWTLRPPSPVHLRIDAVASGDILIRWTRRSRSGWTWIDGADAPLAEESERYRIEIQPSTGQGRALDSGDSTCLYTMADRSADGGSAAESVVISVRQYGAGGLSAHVTGEILL